MSSGASIAPAFNCFNVEEKQYMKPIKMLVCLMLTGLSFQASAQETAPAQPNTAAAQTTAPAPATAAAPSSCPCNFSSGFPDTSKITNGGISCMVKYAVKQDPTVVRLKPSYSITLAAIDYQAGAGNKPAPASTYARWTVNEEIFYNQDTSGVPTRMCLDQVGNKQEIIPNDTAYQACINDIKRTALAIGVTCGSAK